MEEIQDYLLYFSPVLAVCSDVIVRKDTNGFEEELCAVEVKLFCPLEHLLHDQLLVFKKLAISLFQPLCHVVKHLCKAFLEVSLSSGSIVHNAEQVDGNGFEVIWVEVVDQVSVVDEVSMFDEEEAVD